MEQLGEIALRSGSTRLAERSERRLSAAESLALTVLLDQMSPAYPHQQLTEETAEVWREAIERLAVKYGVPRVRTVLANFLVTPGQKFFPHPSEIAEALEELMANERAQFLKDHPYTPCGKCHEGMVILKREDGRSYADECECKKAWRRSCEPAKSEPNYERARVQGQ